MKRRTNRKAKRRKPTMYAHPKSERSGESGRRMESVASAKAQHRIDMALARDEVLRRDGGLCSYCGGEADTVDHIFSKPDSRRLGISRTDPDWMVAACADDNIRRETRHLVPDSWAARIPELNEMTPRRPWRVYSGGSTPKDVLR